MTSNPEPVPDELAIVYARMSGLLLSEQTVTTVLELITSLAQDTLPGSVGAGVTLIAPDTTPTTSAATDPIVEHLDALQYDLGQGPCLSAARDQAVVRIDDLTTERRWPQWSARAAAEGMRSTLSAPLGSAGSSLGAIKVYSTNPHTYTATSEDVLRRFAEQAAILLSNIHTLTEAEHLSDRLKETLRSRDTIATAKGIVMLREHLDTDAALRWMLEQSGRRRVPVHRLAADIIASVAGIAS